MQTRGAEHAGVSKGTIYHRFSSRERLVAGLVEELVSECVGHAIEAARTAPTPRDRLETYLRGIWTIQYDEPAANDILIRAEPGSAPTSPPPTFSTSSSNTYLPTGVHCVSCVTPTEPCSTSPDGARVIESFAIIVEELHAWLGVPLWSTSVDRSTVWRLGSHRLPRGRFTLSAVPSC